MNGQEAINALNNGQRFDLVLLDIIDAEHVGL